MDSNFKIELKFNLKRSAMISIARILWMSPDIKKIADDLIQHGKVADKLVYPKPGEEGYDKDFEVLIYSRPPWFFPFEFPYIAWENVIKKVLHNVTFLSVFGTLKNDLERTVILIGEKIYYYYSTRVMVCQPRCTYSEKDFCVQHFSPYGTDVDIHHTLHHFKHHPKKTDEEFNEFLLDACYCCQENIVAQYQEEIIRYLEDRTPGLSFKDKKDVVFNILCVYFYTYYHEADGIDGKFALPQEYLNNTDYIIPLQEIYELCIYSKYRYCTSLQSCPYFITKLNSLGLLPVKANLVPSLKDDHGFNHNYRNRSCFYMDFHTGKFVVLTLNALSPKERLRFIRRNVNELIVLFLPIWPYQELIPDILDICAANKVKFEYKFILRFTIHCIAIQNTSLYPVHKGILLNAFRKIWDQTPKGIKLSVLIDVTNIFIREKRDSEQKNKADLWCSYVTQYVSVKLKNFFVASSVYLLLFLSWCFGPSRFLSFLEKFLNVLPLTVSLKYFIQRLSLVPPQRSNLLPKTEALKMILDDEELKMKEAEVRFLIFQRCKKVLENEKPGFMKKLVSDIVISYKEAKEFGEKLVGKYRRY